MTYIYQRSTLYVCTNFCKNMSVSSEVLSTKFYQGLDFSLEDIRVHLNNFPGGSVDIKMDETSGVASICLNHPGRKNSITGKMMVDLESAVNKLEAWKTGKGVIVFGAEGSFCSGGDLYFAEKTGTAEGGYKMSKFMQLVLTRLQQLPMISVAFIEGFALGGAAELAISCDYRLFANHDSAMGFVHGKMGIIPAWGGLSAAVQTLGYRRTLDLLMTARVVRGAEAERMGLCDAVVGDMAGASAWLAERTKHDASVVRAAKSVAFNTRQSGDISEALEFEKRVFSPLWGGPANKLALSKKIKHNR